MSTKPARDASESISSVHGGSDLSVRLAKKWRKSQEIVLPFGVIALLFVVWDLSIRLFSIPVYLLPSPGQILAVLWEQRAQVLVHTEATLFTILAGFLLSIVTAIPIAAVLTLSTLGRAAIYPLLVLSQSIPKVALAPILVLLLGTNVLPKIIITFLIAFFPLVISTAAGLAATPAELLELGRSLKANRMKELFRIRLPYAIPFLFSGLKMAITLSVIGAVVGEFVAADQGLGYLMTSALAFFNTPLGYGAIVVLSLLAIILFQIVCLIERVFFPWSLRMQN
ncbi:MAG: ABC transporter permease [Pseudomonadota bacterium]